MDDLDRIAAHFGISLLELLSGAQVALEALPPERRTSTARQTALPAA
ncbi:hypothetical protein KGD82_27600 (plasmid) [Nocardiopsis eucommiae]|uniref:Uncharacterized protein n=1 Tax=Nocardiopsis eucommiae TaxID=2831970 RepID=A0A975QML3_9ACTN|nr:hypothetical protein KGD82_27600 [Nocardiopsis eucommiae]